MGRKKVRHELIANESTRKITFHKRKAGLLKKLRELVTLCGIPACGIIYSHYTQWPDVWPSDDEAFNLLHRLKKLPSEKRGKYSLDQKKFLRKIIAKLSLDLDKEQKRNNSLQLGLVAAGFFPGKDVVFDCLHELNDAVCLLDQKIRAVDSKLGCDEGEEIPNSRVPGKDLITAIQGKAIDWMDDITGSFGRAEDDGGYEPSYSREINDSSSSSSLG